MQKQAPTIGRLATMVLFALSCFGLLTFLWLAFGGPIPLKPTGYQVRVAFDEATQLAKQSPVNVAGVPVGEVVKVEPTPNASQRNSSRPKHDSANSTIVAIRPRVGACFCIYFFAPVDEVPPQMAGSVSAPVRPSSGSSSSWSCTVFWMTAQVPP